MLSRMTIQSRRSLLSVRNPEHQEVWSSRFVGEAMGRPTTPGNPSPRSCRGSILPSSSTSASTRPRSMSRTWQHSPGRLQPGAPDQCPELSPDAFWALVRPTNRPLLACSLPSFGDRVAIYPPLLNPREDGPSPSTLFVTHPPAESLGNQVGRLTFIFLSSWGLEAHTTLRNGCRCHRHC